VQAIGLRTEPAARWGVLRSWRTSLVMAALLVALGFASVLALAKHRVGMPVSSASVAAAPADLVQGLQAWSDGDTQEARLRFTAASQAAALDGRGALYAFAVTTWIDMDARARALEARRLRGSLDEQDTELLEALTPLLSDPPETDETAHRLQSLVQGGRARPVTFLAAAEFYLRSSLPDEALALVPHLPPPAAARVAARAAMEKGDVPHARDLLQRCVRAHPAAVDCLAWLARLEAMQGSCDEGEKLARQMIARAPGNYLAYTVLAASIFGRTQSTAAARSAVDARTAHAPESWREEARIGSNVMLSLFDARFSEALAGTRQWIRVATEHGPKDDVRTGYPLSINLRILRELGRMEEARAMAVELANTASALLPSDVWDARFHAACAQYDLGLLSRAELVAERERALRRHARGTLLGSPAMRWLQFFVDCSVDPATVEDAIEAESPEATAIDVVLLEAATQANLGQYFARAGRLEEARRWLASASRACSYADPLATIQAQLTLGEVEERLGNKDDACLAYGRVLERWGSSPESRTAAAARFRGDALHCWSK
jgi:tetratricopeptide (TPR) repeat protein